MADDTNYSDPGLAAAREALGDDALRAILTQELAEVGVAETWVKLLDNPSTPTDKLPPICRAIITAMNRARSFGVMAGSIIAQDEDDD